MFRTSLRTLPAGLLPAFLAAALLLPASSAEAQQEPPWFVGLGLGPAIRIDNAPTQVRLAQEIGYHFDGSAGFYLSLGAAQSFGASRWAVFFGPQAGYLFTFYSRDGIEVQAGPAGGLGVAIGGQLSNAGGRDPSAYFHAIVGGIARLLLDGGRYVIYLRPFELEFATGRFGPFNTDSTTIGGGDSAGFVRFIVEAGLQLPFG